MLDYETLEALAEDLGERLKTELPRILIELNREETLETWLSLMNLDDLLPSEAPVFQPFPTGKIVILGSSAVKEKEIQGIAKKLGIEKQRLECVLDYDSTVNYNYQKLLYNSNYSLILVGPMPHNTTGTDGYGSTIAALEQTDGYPPVIRLGRTDLRITKSGLQEALSNAIQKGWVQV